MRDVVRQAFVPFTAPLEGVVPWMYPDVKNLVSVGIGNLIDPIQLALGLPFVRPDGTPAQRDEIATEWLRIKNLPPDARGRTAAMLGHLYAKAHAKLRLTDEGVRSLVAGKLAQMDAQLAKRFPEYEDWPCDAQLGTLSMAWACGAAFRFPKLEAALKARDFATAAVECFMPEERTISGLRPRNKANAVLYRNAAIVASGLNPDALYYPTDLESHPVDPDADTQPELVTVNEFPIVHPPVYVEPDDEPPPQAA